MTARQQFAFFGASNLALSREAAIQAAARRSSGPLDLVFADGFGRSYVAESSVLGRVLPGIGACGALDALEGSAPLSAVVTDVGNDLAYGRTSAEVLDAVAGVLTRLAALKARVVVTGLPLAPLHATSPRAFRFFSRLFFPQRRIARAEGLPGGLQQSLEAFGKHTFRDQIAPDQTAFDLVDDLLRADSEGVAERPVPGLSAHDHPASVELHDQTRPQLQGFDRPGQSRRQREIGAPDDLGRELDGGLDVFSRHFDHTTTLEPSHCRGIGLERSK